MASDFNNIWNVIKGYFNVLPDKEDEQETIHQISSGVVFHGANLWVLIFAIFIASLGLNVNSTAVIIGAMLISPLMGPIIGMGLAVGINDFALLKRAFKNYAVATVISVITATIYFALTPLNEAQSELLARTSPTLYDVLIALCGGAAGILAMATKGKGNVIPGVAIATALMPPLCTAGYGLAMGNLYYFFGAFYLFFINTVFICLATFLGVRMMKFERKHHDNHETLERVRRYILAVVIVTMVPAVFMTVVIIRKSFFENNVRKFVKNELVFKGTQIISTDINKKNKVLSVVAVGKEIENKERDNAQIKMANYGLDGYTITIYQGTQSDSVLRLNNKLTDIASSNKANTQTMLEQSARIRQLETQLYSYTRYGQSVNDINSEMKVLFPSYYGLGLSRTAEASADSGAVKEYVLAVVKVRGRQINAETNRLQRWLGERLKADSIKVVVAN
ncbi:MAG: TIGR00341 family protein [Prevotella sp.]|nr:TIGR00341 family protein [Prevotella sp.]